MLTGREEAAASASDAGSSSECACMRVEGSSGSSSSHALQHSNHDRRLRGLYFARVNVLLLIGDDTGCAGRAFVKFGGVLCFRCGNVSPKWRGLQPNVKIDTT